MERSTMPLRKVNHGKPISMGHRNNHGELLVITRLAFLGEYSWVPWSHEWRIDGFTRVNPSFSGWKIPSFLVDVPS